MTLYIREQLADSIFAEDGLLQIVTREHMDKVEKELKFHEIYQYIYMSKLKQCGMNFIWKHDYFKELLRPDLVIAYTLNNRINISCIEIDYTHPTNIDKIKKYEYCIKPYNFTCK